MAAAGFNQLGSNQVGLNKEGLGQEEPGQDGLRVAVDATPLLGPPTGVGVMATAVIEGLATYDRVSASGFLVSWRGRKSFGGVLPTGVNPVVLPVPAQLAHRLWLKADWPRLKGFDVVHGLNFVVPPTGRSAVELITIHDMTAWRYPEMVDAHTRNYPGLIERALTRGAHVHTVSDFVAAEVAEHFGLEPARIHSVPNGIKRAEQGRAAEGLALAGGRPFVLAVGTIEPRKDYPLLLAAMDEVLAHNDDLVLVIAGGRGWGSDAFDAAVAKMAHSDRLVYLGYVSDQQRADLLAGASVFVYPSVYEGFGLPPLEAMVAQVPVVATKAGAVSEVCGDGACLVPTGDADALAGAIGGVLADEGLRVDLVSRGTARVADFDWGVTVDNLVDVYHQISIGP